MTSRFWVWGKCELLAQGLFWSGTTALLARLPQRSSLLVLNYHGAGNLDDDLFDPGVFPATAGVCREQHARETSSRA